MNASYDAEFRPRLRPIEAFPLPSDDDEGGKYALRDASGLSDAYLTVTEGALQVIALVNGERNIDDIRSAFQDATGFEIDQDTVAHMFDQLDTAHFLEGASFESFYSERHQEYVDCGVRVMTDAEGLGVDAKGQIFDSMLTGAVAIDDVDPASIRGLVAPHLDYPRGAPCYAISYNTLRRRPTPDRVIILGTNHFGRSASVVATASSFETPLGMTAVDLDFLERLESRCGPLRRFEMDHAREHSIELQVAWLQHLFGADRFQILPALCPDPCGPTGTAPYDGDGVDLADFAQAIGDLMEADGKDTLLIAGADLSHVGRSFGDDRDIDAGFLAEVEAKDRASLMALVQHGPQAFVAEVAKDDNPTRICSAGCIFAVATALQGKTATLGGYHQAATPENDTCVSCTSMVFTES
ncbi:MAG: AmmeMemoRadiSam system protein B [Phycisphaerae bacterium]